MGIVRCHKRTIILVGVLWIISVILVMKKISTSNCSTVTECILIQARNEEERSSLLVRHIRQNVLKPPAAAETKLRLSYGVWSSPVTALVLDLLQNKKHGFFVEAGALNGEEISNSIELEVNYGWEGLLVEPDPKNLLQLYGKNRKSWIAPVCLSPTDQPQKIKMEMYDNFRHLTNIPEYFHNENVPNDNHTTIEIECFPLYSLLQSLNRTDIDYLSLDIEGAELSVLKTLPFDKMSIKVISVEMNKKDELFSFLVSKGYKLKKTFDLPNAGVRDAVFQHES